MVIYGLKKVLMPVDMCGWDVRRILLARTSLVLRLACMMNRIAIEVAFGTMRVLRPGLSVAKPTFQ